MMSRVRLFALVLLSFAASARGGTPELRGFVLGKGDSPAPNVLEAKSGGRLSVSGTGRRASAHLDEGGFAGFSTEELNFTFVARMKGAVGGGKGARFGLAVQAGLAGNDKAVSLMYDAAEARRCVQWFMRYHVVANTHQGSRRCFIEGHDLRFDQPDGLWLKLVRRYPYVELSASKDGKSWEKMPYLPVLSQAKVWVGLQVTAGGDGKEPLTATFDNVSFAIDPGDARSIDTPATFKEHAPDGKKYTIYFAKVNTGTTAKPAFATSYVIVPDGMDAKKMRCLLWTPGSKEIATVGGGTLAFRSGKKDTPEAGLRLPADFDQDEGVYHTDKLDPVHAMLEHHGILRMGTLHFSYQESLERLAKISGIPQLAHLPFVATGASAAGGRASTAARKLPELAVACAPTLIGAAGIEEVDKYAQVPFLHIVGSKDGVHLRQVVEAAAVEREKHALWGAAPMWWVYHHTHKQMALMDPYFADCVARRVPSGHDFSTGPAKLNALKEEDGYLGLIDSWETNYPQAVPFKDYQGDRSKTVWLPTSRVARAWQSFVSYDPRTVIHFPTFEGNNTIGQPQPNGWRNSHLAADEPFEMVASGPTGEAVKVRFYADLEPLKVARQDRSQPYRLTAAGLPPGLHVLYAITTIGGTVEISRPVTVMFHRRAPK
jgi:hypothetical protein